MHFVFVLSLYAKYRHTPQHVVCPSGFSDHLTDQSSDKESGSGSQTDLRKIPSLPATTDFLSNSGASSRTKLMTPDAFMTPSTSVTSLSLSRASSTASLSLSITTCLHAGVKLRHQPVYKRVKQHASNYFCMLPSNIFSFTNSSVVLHIELLLALGRHKVVTLVVHSLCKLWTLYL